MAKKVLLHSSYAVKTGNPKLLYEYCLLSGLPNTIATHYRCFGSSQIGKNSGTITIVCSRLEKYRTKKLLFFKLFASVIHMGCCLRWGQMSEESSENRGEFCCVGKLMIM